MPEKNTEQRQMCCPYCSDQKYPCVKMERAAGKKAREEHPEESEEKKEK